MSLEAELTVLRETTVRPNRLRDTQWLDRYLAGSSERPPILLGLGETWTDTPPQLIRALADVPGSAHGYQLSMYGLPRLRAVLKDYMTVGHRIAQWEGSYEVAVNWGGTRSTMADFAQLIRDRRPGSLRATVVAPAWDYAGVLEPLGFDMQYLDVSENGWQPDRDLVQAFAAKAGRTDLLVLNPQHNPTGLSWSADALDALLDLARSSGAAILVDDAYYGFANPGDDRVSAVTAILADDQLRSMDWLQVRSMGKQFHCNGWGIGAVTGPPQLLDDVVNNYRARRVFNTGALEQHAMASWLADKPAVTDYLRDERETYAHRRHAVGAALAAAGCLPGDIIAGPTAPYALIPVVADYMGRTDDYLEACAVRAGVFLSSIWPSDRALNPGVAGDRHVRMFLGAEADRLTEAVIRLRDAGLA